MSQAQQESVRQTKLFLTPKAHGRRCNVLSATARMRCRQQRRQPDRDKRARETPNEKTQPALVCFAPLSCLSTLAPYIMLSISLVDKYSKPNWGERETAHARNPDSRHEPYPHKFGCVCIRVRDIHHQITIGMQVPSPVSEI